MDSGEHSNLTGPAPEDTTPSIWRRTLAVAVTIVLFGVAFVVWPASAPEGGSMLGALSPAAESQDPASSVDSAPERAEPVSRGVTRFPLEPNEEWSVTVVVDGQSHELTTRAANLAEALAEAGIDIGIHDDVSAPMSSRPAGEVSIDRVVESIETVVEDVPYTTIRKETSSLVKGTEKVQTKGKTGEVSATKRVLRKEGDVLSEETLAEAVGSEPVTEVILVGTGAPVAARPSGPPGGSSGPVTTYSASSAKGIAQGLLPSYGFGMDQWSCLENLWQRESGWNVHARNRSSGAYGIPQSLPGSKMASAGPDWQNNAATQIKWGLGYIKSRYSTPCGAWGTFTAKGWY